MTSGRNESATGMLDGGINLQGNPISLVLYNTESTNIDDANFNIWRHSLWGLQGTQPLLNINGLTGQTTFTNSNVAINNGTLSVGGSPVVLTSTASTIVGGLGFLKTTDLGTVLSQTSPPTSSNWTSTYVPRGNVMPLPGLTEGGSLALATSTASGEKSIAVGAASTASGKSATAIGTLAVASNEFSTAIGQNAKASGMFSVAMGNSVTSSGMYTSSRGYNSTASAPYSETSGLNATASGPFSRASGMATTATGGWTTVGGGSSSASGSYSFVYGYGLKANAGYETIFGRYNTLSSTASWYETDGLFRLGNGVSATSTSDAMAVLKNGQTTLTNKAWKNRNTATISATSDPSTEVTDADGNALVVDGHTVLNGKVVISVPQGDISMGIYN
jgi:trimeric autotransporter adhesin